MFCGAMTPLIMCTDLQPCYIEATRHVMYFTFIITFVIYFHHYVWLQTVKPRDSTRICAIKKISLIYIFSLFSQTRCNILQWKWRSICWWKFSCSLTAYPYSDTRSVVYFQLTSTSFLHWVPLNEINLWASMQGPWSDLLISRCLKCFVKIHIVSFLLPLKC